MSQDKKEVTRSCIHCDGDMIEARLKTPGIDRQVYIDLCEDFLYHRDHNPILVAWVCKKCGYVALFAK